ncbi:MAG: aminotransferase class V-fold PLP-dependent enzyme [Eubacterium sp.]|jgi:glycine hydroxymethyltransferase|nr:aminotransferase class V-fold PLP-dependent enzyme [Eubacterium sp.]
MSKDLYDKLKEYSKSDFYPFHMPGHKRNVKLIKEQYGIDIDITEIDGFDMLYEADDVLKDAMERAKKFWGTEKTYFLVNGSTVGILTAMHSCLTQGDRIIIGRNCHKAVYNASELLKLNNTYLYPKYIPKYGINGGYSAKELENLFEKNSNIKAVVITSPTYDGIVSDIKTLADITHKNGAVLIVDEAHGAHFGISDKFPKPAYDMGADLVIESMHKTLPTFTQTALLHLSKEGKKRVDEKKIKHFWSIFQTSSPSYVFMANMDKCISFLDKNGNEIYEKFSNDIEEFRKKCDKLHDIHIPGKELIGTNEVFDVDLSKLIINSSMGGKPMNDILRKKFHLEMEMEAAKYVLAITTFCDNKEGFDRLYKALDYIDAELKKITNKSEIKKIKNTNFELVRNIQEMSISNAVNSNTKLVDIENAINKVSAEYLYLYPPGIPLIVPGEVVDVKLVEQIKEYKNRNYEIVGYDKFKIVD